MSSPTHAALMDGVYRRQKHIYDATRKYFLLGRDPMIQQLDVPPGGAVLELGCGTGRNLVLANRHYPDARFYGLDISAEMLQSAEKAAARAGFRPHLARADAATFNAGELFGRASFDRIFISYALSMIPAWEETIEHALGHLPPGGSLHIVDFGQQERLPAWFRSSLFDWIARFHVNPREKLFEFIDEKARNSGAVSRCNPLFRGYAWHAIVQMA
ncbi:class I SAM-dependent methyltransferase [Hoeflea poritis]|uniref:Class I SAM-dependent methyltransferase n=1 Tax=Hoeflea poritis TaxID=2993659 RepID=A0ABT4VP81_9HYPH|nr:class I SAM-dependent methyltransferase [Hoeflea poritis]MDA4846515.1 class I SAM-dependent methyltransferase [Hoeflea poritis]